MLNVSSEYLAAIRALSQTIKLSGTIKFPDGVEQPLNEENFGEGSVSIERMCCSGEELEFGSAILGQLKFSLRTAESRYAFYDAVVSLTQSIKLANGTWYDIPLGVFTVAEADRKGSLVELVAYDNLLALSKDYDGTILLGDAYQIMTDICKYCGAKFAQTEDELAQYTNGTETIYIDDKSGCSTFRDCASILAQMMGCFVVADRNGNISLRPFGKEPCTTLAKSNRVSTTISDYLCHYSALVIEASGKSYSSYDMSQESGLELTIEDAPAWDYGTDEILQARCDNLRSELSQIQYTPAKMTIFGDPAIECGDMIELETDSGSVNTLVTGYTWKFRGHMEVDSVGKNPYIGAKKTVKNKAIRDLEKQAEENKLIFYGFTNSGDVVVKDSSVQQVSQVTFVTTTRTSAMFIAQLPLVVACEDNVTTKTDEVEKTVTAKTSSGATAQIKDASGNVLTLTVIDSNTVKTVEPGYVDVQVEYYLDGTLVDYELVQRCHAGHHVLALFYTFASLGANANFTWQVKLKIVGGSGTVTVPKRGLIATITGQGMASTEAWDGTIGVEESASFGINKRERTCLAPVDESTSVIVDDPICGVTFQETTRGFVINHKAPKVAGLGFRVSVGEVILQDTISDWVYDDRYIEKVGEQTMLRKTWEYTSTEQPVSQGRMTVVKAVTNDIASVEEVIVDG